MKARFRDVLVSIALTAAFLTSSCSASAEVVPFLRVPGGASLLLLLNLLPLSLHLLPGLRLPNDHLLPVYSVLRYIFEHGLYCVSVLEHDKSEAPALARFEVLDDIGLGNGSKVGKVAPEEVIGHRPWQAPDENFPLLLSVFLDLGLRLIKGVLALNLAAVYYMGRAKYLTLSCS